MGKYDIEDWITSGEDWIKFGRDTKACKFMLVKLLDKSNELLLPIEIKKHITNTIVDIGRLKNKAERRMIKQHIKEKKQCIPKGFIDLGDIFYGNEELAYQEFIKEELE